MTTPVIQGSFAAGELSPSLYGRVDLAKYHTGVALARNFFVDYRGGLSKRAGGLFVGQCKDSTTANRLIPFQFSTLQTYALAFGNFTMRVIKGGAYVTEPATTITGITQGTPGIFTDTGHPFLTGDLVYLAGIGGATALNAKFGTVVRIDANRFSLLDMFGSPLSTAGLPAYTSGGTASRVFTLATPYAAADLALLKFSQSADKMTLTHPDYAVQELTRTDHWVWTIAAVSFVPTTPIPDGATATPSSGGATVYNYVITALSNTNKTESLPSAVASASSATMSTTAGAKVTVAWTGNPGDTLYNVYRQTENDGGSPPSGSLFGYVGSVVPSSINTFIDQNIAPDFSFCPPQANNPFAVGAIDTAPVTGGGAAYGAAATLVVTDAAGTGAVLLPTIVGGVITGVLVISGGQGYTAPVVTVGNADGGSGATFGTPTLTTENNPFCSTYFQQRQIFGGQTDQPEGLVMSKTGDFHNLTYSTPQRDNDVIQVNIASQTVNAIKHMVPLTSLVVLTGSGAWRVDGGSQSDAITPSHILAVPQAYNGCSDVPPLVINYDILYVQAKGSIVRDLSYNFYVNVYTGTDISMLSNHLFYGHTITEWCWAEEPFKTVWAVRDDGVLLSLTYLKEQEVYGWARHDTDGLYRSICSISEGEENAVYAVVERLVQGQTLQYIERFASRNMGGDPSIDVPADVTRAWFVDCGLQYPQPTPAAALTPSALDAQPVIADVDVVFGGVSYSAPVVSVSDPTGVGAVFSATVVGGVITDINVDSPGVNYTRPQIQITDPTGSGAVAAASTARPVAMNADVAVFSGGDVGKVLRINGGSGTVTAVSSAQQVVVDIMQPLTSVWAAASGEWSLTQPVSAVHGLDHLEGGAVVILADGNVQPPQVVTNGAVTLAVEASAITVGLPYTAQVKSLYLDVQEQGGTIQSKRKKISAVTIRTVDTRGLKVGPDFDHLREIKDRTTEPMGQAVRLFTGDRRIVIDPIWKVDGQMCVQSDDPLPATLLAFIPEITIGDT